MSNVTQIQKQTQALLFDLTGRITLALVKKETGLNNDDIEAILHGKADFAIYEKLFLLKEMLEEWNANNMIYNNMIWEAELRCLDPMSHCNSHDYERRL